MTSIQNIKVSKNGKSANREDIPVRNNKNNMTDAEIFQKKVMEQYSNGTFVETLKIDIKSISLMKYKDRDPSEINSSKEFIALIESIKKHGQQVPAIVRRANNSRYELISGYRRYAALKEVGENFLTCVVLEGIDNKKAISIQREENRNRSDISDWSLFLHFSKLINDSVFKNKAELSKFLGYSSQKISRIFSYSKLEKNITHNLIGLDNMKNISMGLAETIHQLMSDKDIKHECLNYLTKNINDIKNGKISHTRMRSSIKRISSIRKNEAIKKYSFSQNVVIDSKEICKISNDGIIKFTKNYQSMINSEEDRIQINKDIMKFIEDKLNAYLKNPHHGGF